MLNVKNWSHVFKLDPNKSIEERYLKDLCESGTDAIIIGGTDGITFDNVFDLQDRVQKYDITCILEVSTMEAIMPGFNGYFIPLVLNSREKRYVMDIQHQAVKEYGDWIDWREMAVEGYCVMNEQAKVFEAAQCQLPSKEDVLAYAKMAEHMFNLPIFYLEYSGTWGDAELVRDVAAELKQTVLFYGGGIETLEQAKIMKEHADVIVVGNIIYEDVQAALQTVNACKH
ncbi:heptaprenylglyceryl phosphate synthase [Halobacillus sp. A1]|uniref:heptaprenylglyceryl phosphate synthase n=1 Tax=Halobacillus sp. A1 TaxID=2880262 RepID=UPI0020A6CA6A|nr:heptaprenylglyceryl phosphate synthase [Halobacillus sp. A1]